MRSIETYLILSFTTFIFSRSIYSCIIPLFSLLPSNWIPLIAMKALLAFHSFACCCWQRTSFLSRPSSLFSLYLFIPPMIIKKNLNSLFLPQKMPVKLAFSSVPFQVKLELPLERVDRPSRVIQLNIDWESPIDDDNSVAKDWIPKETFHGYKWSRLTDPKKTCQMQENKLTWIEPQEPRSLSQVVPFLVTYLSRIDMEQCHKEDHDHCIFQWTQIQSISRFPSG